MTEGGAKIVAIEPFGLARFADGRVVEGRVVEGPASVRDAPRLRGPEARRFVVPMH